MPEFVCVLIRPQDDGVIMRVLLKQIQRLIRNMLEMTTYMSRGVPVYPFLFISRESTHPDLARYFIENILIFAYFAGVNLEQPGSGTLSQNNEKTVIFIQKQSQRPYIQPPVDHQPAPEEQIQRKNPPEPLCRTTENHKSFHAFS